MRRMHIHRAALVLIALTGLVRAAEAPMRIEQGSLIYEGIPAAAMQVPASLAAWQESRGAALLGWLGNGGLLVAMRVDETAQLQRVSEPLAAPEPLTAEPEPVSRAIAHPYDANLVVYLQDRGGDESYQLWLKNLADGSQRLLTDGSSRHGMPVMAHDGQRIAFPGNAVDPASNDIFLADTTSEALPRLLLTGGSADLSVEDWSIDDRQLAVIRYRSINDSELLLVDVATGEETPIEPAPRREPVRRGTRANGPASVGEARFARDGRGLYFTSDRGGEFMALHHLDLRQQQLTTLTPDPRWDVEQFELSSDGRFLAYTLNEAGFSRLVLRDLRLQADVLLPALPVGAIIDKLAFDHRQNRLAVELETAGSPSQVLVYDIAGEDPAELPLVSLAPWTTPDLGGIDASKPVSAELIEYPTWDLDGNQPRRLSAFVLQPASPGPHPVLIDIHGGPESQARPRWDAFRQYLVNELGYVVVAPNVRGSAGYGRSFLKLDNGVLREDSVRDIGALLVWISAQPGMDRNRVVVAGGSYGGYMALASLVQYGDRLAGGIDMVGITSFVTFLTNTSGYRRDLRRAEYGDERDPAMRAHLTSISPLTNVASIRKPLLIGQGLNDPRVPASESEQMKFLLRARGGEVWYLAAKDEGHGFRKKGNVDAWRSVIVAFLQSVGGTPE